RGALEGFLGTRQIAAVQGGEAQLHIGVGGSHEIDGAAVAGAHAGGERDGRQQRGQAQPLHGRTPGRGAAGNVTTGTPMRLPPRREVVRSTTRPASWPQAASISSPRVFLIVAMTPPFNTWSRKVLMTSGRERRYSVPGNGLNGIRLTLAGCPRKSRASARACAGESFTPS